MMYDSLCPYCGAKNIQKGWNCQWACGSARSCVVGLGHMIHRTHECRIGETRVLRGKIEELQRELEARDILDAGRTGNG